MQSGISRNILLGLALLGALACGAAGLMTATGPVARAQALSSAERRWQARPFRAYHIALEDFRCVLDIEVHGDHVTSAVPREACQRDARSIGDLFTLIHRDGALSTTCITQRCACDDYLSVRASYDAALGYPREIEVRITAQPNWRHPDFWRYTLDHLRPPSCSFPVGRKLIRILELEPIQN